MGLWFFHTVQNLHMMFLLFYDLQVVCYCCCCCAIQDKFPSVRHCEQQKVAVDWYDLVPTVVSYSTCDCGLRSPAVKLCCFAILLQCSCEQRFKPTLAGASTKLWGSDHRTQQPPPLIHTCCQQQQPISSRRYYSACRYRRQWNLWSDWWSIIPLRTRAEPNSASFTILR